MHRPATTWPNALARNWWWPRCEPLTKSSRAQRRRSSRPRRPPGRCSSAPGRAPGPRPASSRTYSSNDADPLGLRRASCGAARASAASQSARADGRLRSTGAAGDSAWWVVTSLSDRSVGSIGAGSAGRRRQDEGGPCCSLLLYRDRRHRCKPCRRRAARESRPCRRHRTRPRGDPGRPHRGHGPRPRRGTRLLHRGAGLRVHVHARARSRTTTAG